MSSRHENNCRVLPTGGAHFLISLPLHIPLLSFFLYPLLQAPVARRAQTLNYINGYAVPGEKATGLQPVAPMAPAEMVEADAAPSTLPAWVAYDRKVR